MNQLKVFLFIFIFFFTKLMQIKGLIWLYNIFLWYTIVKLNSTTVYEDKCVWSQEFYHFVPAENWLSGFVVTSIAVNWDLLWQAND